MSVIMKQGMPLSSVQSFLLLTLTGLLFACNLDQEDPPPPNILWIVSEDNSCFLGAYGDSFATTPQLDQLANEGVLYTHAFANAPVCAPARSTLITGMYPPSLGTQHMRSRNPLPEFVSFFPTYLREIGYYCTNNSKKDYNVANLEPEGAWDASSREATYTNRSAGQPFFAVFNIGRSHESSIHDSIPDEELRHQPSEVPIPPYHPRTPAMKHDWAQYYDRVEQMDSIAGTILAELEASGLADSTIVFYYSDHGGVLGRSKRFLYESGLHVPLIIRFPEAYQHLAPSAAGTENNQIVSFVDFAPTVLSLANLPAPEYMQGTAFLGPHQGPAQKKAFCFRGRMDERMDVSRSVRNERFLYTRHFMPHRKYAQYLEYLWRAPSMRSWEAAYRAGATNELQSRFFEAKPSEELYDCVADPHNVQNLANDPAYSTVREELRKTLQDWQSKIRDLGFVPEPMLLAEAANQTPFQFGQSVAYPFERVQETAFLATDGDPERMATLLERMQDSAALVRYWAAVGAVVLAEEYQEVPPQLEALLTDAHVSVRIVAAEAVWRRGQLMKALPVLKSALAHANPMARVQALNVLEEMGVVAAPLAPEIRALLPEDSDNRDYDVRAARRLLEQFSKG